MTRVCCERESEVTVLISGRIQKGSSSRRNSPWQTCEKPKGRLYGKAFEHSKTSEYPNLGLRTYVTTAGADRQCRGPFGLTRGTSEGMEHNCGFARGVMYSDGGLWRLPKKAVQLRGLQLGEAAVGPWPKGPFGDCGSVGTIETGALPPH